MSTIPKTLKQLSEISGITPTDDEIKLLHQYASILNAQDNDPFLTLLTFLLWYRSSLSTIPENIIKTSDKVVNDTTKICEEKLKTIIANKERLIASAESTLANNLNNATNNITDHCKKEIEKATKELPYIVQHTAIQLAAEEQKISRYKWICMTIIVVLLFFSSAVLTGYYVGNKSGYDLGKAEAIEINDFTDTEEYKAAYIMFKNGDLKSIVNCTRKGWIIEDNMCWPATYRDEHGRSRSQPWYMPF